MSFYSLPSRIIRKVCLTGLVAEYLLSMREILGSIPRTAKNLGKGLYVKLVLSSDQSNCHNYA